MGQTKEKQAADSVTVAIQGRLGSDPETRVVGKYRIVNASIVVGQRKKNAAGHWEDDKPMWFRLVSFGSDLDEFEKGDKVFAQGRLALKVWQNREGEDRSTYEIMVTGANLVSKPKPKAETDLPNEAEDDFPE